ncbi:MAG: phytoene desaturase [Bosea sp. (in: a-proteobacteria)]
MTAPLRHPVPGGTAKPHAVVIGSGFGGLAAAARLCARGYQVIVLEKLDQPGGRARMFKQDGFSFDAGPTIITAPFVLEELWKFCGGKLSDDVRLVPMEPFYRLRFYDGTTFDASSDPEAMRREIARLSPEDLAGYERFFARSKTLYEIGFEDMGTVPYSTLIDLIKSVPDIVRLQGYRSIHALVSDYIKDERIRMALSFHPLFIGGNPYSASAIYGLIAYLERTWGVHYAMGGTHTLAQGMVGLIERQGGQVRFNAEVAEITLDGRRATGVRLASGETISADIVVSNADAAWTYRKLLPSRARSKWSDARLDRSRYSMSLFVWYFGTDKRFEDVPHHTILMGPRYKGLLDDIFTHKVLAEDFSLYLHRPTATDPSMAPSGCDAFYVLSPVPNLAGGQDWESLAEGYRQAIENRLAETVLPDLGKHVVSSRIMTPNDFRDDLLSVHGAAFGLEPVLLQSAYFRPHNKSEDIVNLFMVGAGTHPGAGLPGVVTSARILDEVIPHAHTFA